MEKIGPIVKQWYTALSNGKIMGKKCTRCGAVSFPPV
ncbi:MAG: zinc ribbon domain-containing protein, partial [Agathobacter sp.]